MDITFIAIALFILLVIVFLLLFLLKSINKKSFIADDGSVFENKKDLDLYQKLYKKKQPLFSVVDDKDSNQSILGFEKSFILKLTSEGFKDLKSITRYRNEFKSLYDLINI
tara:strand:+ start:658 stop:990 length:333 start_codon:yes stop_codon:yes gene_type:complete